MPIEIIGTTLPICPHCGHDHQDSYLEFSLLMNNWGTRECDFCGQEFRVMMETVYSTKIISQNLGDVVNARQRTWTAAKP